MSRRIISYLLVSLIVILSVNGFQSSHQCLNNVHYGKYTHQNNRKISSELRYKKEEATQTIVKQKPEKTAVKSNNFVIDILYKGLLVEPIFGSLGLLKTTEEIKKLDAFEAKLASIRSLENDNVVTTLPDNVVSVTIAPKKLIRTTSTDSTPLITPQTKPNKKTTTATIKSPDLRDELWVVRKLKEIRTRESEVASTVTIPTISSSSSAATTTTTTKPSVTVTPKSTTTTATVAPTGLFNEVTLKPTTVQSSTDSVKSAALALSKAIPTTSSVVTMKTQPIVSKIAPKETIAPKIVAKKEIDPNAIYDLEQIGHSVLTEGIEYGPVDNYATDVTITSDTFKLPQISMNEDPEYKNAQDVIKMAGLSGSIAYGISEVGFWAFNLPIILSSYHSSTNQWLDISNPTDRVSTLLYTLYNIKYT